MPVFQYTARTLKGDLQQGEVDLPSRDDVVAHLRKNRMVVVQVRPAPKKLKISFKFGGGGEAGGLLDTILLRLAVFLEKNDAIIRKVKGAMIYPAVIFSVAGIAVTVLLIFVIPTFQAMFASVNLELPLPTRVVIGASNVLKHYWWAIIAVAVATVLGINRYYKTVPG